MARGLSIRMGAEPCRSLAFGAIGGGYAAIGTALEYPARIILVQNFTDVTVWFSFNGVDDHFPLARDGHMILDITLNNTQDSGFYLAAGDRLYCKRFAGDPTTGNVFFTSFYGR